MKSYFIEKEELREYVFNDIKFKIIIGQKTFPPSNWAEYLLHHIEIKSGEDVIDIGTGTGILAIYAAKLGGNVFATDISPDAIRMTKRNAILNGVNINCKTGSYFASNNKKFDVIISNMPQSIIPNNHSKPHDLHYTIDGGKGGNEFIIGLLDRAKNFMKKGTRMYIPVNSLSYFQETFSHLFANYTVILKHIYVNPIKDFQIAFTEYYLTLHREGKICILNQKDGFKHMLYILEVRL